MSKGNGNGGVGYTVASPLPPKTATFRIGGEDLAVPAIGFFDIDANEELRDHLAALSPDITRREYVERVLAIIAIQLAPYRSDLTVDVLKRALGAGEANDLVTATTELLRASGFQIPETVPETTAPTPEPTASPGTGTSTASAPASRSAASAAATRSS